MNSAICGGLRGVSDTMASALWGTDMLFGLAEAGVRNVDFHTWTGSIYGPIDWRPRRTARRVAKVRPLFYAMLLFNRATPPGSKLLAVGPNAGGARLKTWGTIDRAGTRRFVAINKDHRLGRRARAHPARPASRATSTVERLVAPGAKSENNVTFGGRGWGGTTADGKPKGKRRIERVRTGERSAAPDHPARLRGAHHRQVALTNAAGRWRRRRAIVRERRSSASGHGS